MLSNYSTEGGDSSEETVSPLTGSVAVAVLLWQRALQAVFLLFLNGSGGYDWDFPLENNSEMPVTVYITAYKTEQTQENEVKF